MKREDAEEFTHALAQIASGSWRQIALAKRLGVPKALGLSVEDWVNNRLGGYIRMSVAERAKAVEELKAEGLTNRETAKVLGVAEGTVRNDLGAQNCAPDNEKSNQNNEDSAQNCAPEKPKPEPEKQPEKPLDALAILAADAKVKTAAATTEKRQAKEEKREARREENREKIKDAATLDDLIAKNVKVSTIAIDPPWDWGDEGDQDQLGRARPDYATMTFEELLNYPVGAVADVDCHLYCWITNRSLPKGFALLERWGFRYITTLTWAKPSFGMGNYFRGQSEHILFGVKGSLALKRKDAGTVLNWPRGDGGHSSKPKEFWPFVKSCSPGPYLEIFQRTETPDVLSIGENVSRADAA